MATLASLRTDTRNVILQTDPNNSSFNGAAGLDTFINEAIRYLGALVEYPRAPFTYASVSNQANYTINTATNRIISILSAYFGNRTIAGDLKEIGILKENTLASINPSWYETVANNNGRPQRIILLDRDTFWCDPKPDATYSASGYNFYLFCSTVPVDLAAAGEVPNLPFAYHDVVPYHAASIAFLAIKEQENSDKCMAIFDKKRKELENKVVKESDQFLAFSFVSPDPTESAEFGRGMIVDQSGARLI